MKQKPVTIKMRLATEKVLAHDFLQSIRDFIEILEDITDSFYGTRQAIPWSVKVEPGSNVLAAIPGEPIRPEIKPRVVSTALKNGWKILKSGARPETLPNRTLERVKSLTYLLQLF
jgi:hypothetical protein